MIVNVKYPTLRDLFKGGGNSIRCFECSEAPHFALIRKIRGDFGVAGCIMNTRTGVCVAYGHKIGDKVSLYLPGDKILWIPHSDGLPTFASLTQMKQLCSI